MTHIEKMKQWLGALELCNGAETVDGVVIYTDKEITSLRQAIAETEKENALQALHNENEKLGLYKDAYGKPVIDKSAAIRIATALGWEPKREWVGLTDEEIEALASWWPSYDQMPALKVLIKDVTNSLKEKNT